MKILGHIVYVTYENLRLYSVWNLQKSSAIHFMELTKILDMVVETILCQHKYYSLYI